MKRKRFTEERRACAVIAADRKMIRYQSRRPLETELRERLRELANERRRFGYRRLFILLRREGEPSGVNRIYRLYRVEGLGVRKRKGRKRAIGIRELLVRKLAGELRIPARSTVHAVLDRHGLVAQARKRRHRSQGTTLSEATAPNDLWCADFKGEFKLGNGQYCYPLTVSDQVSRYLLAIETFDSTREEPVIAAFQHLFAERGLPRAIRSGNGLPFASPNGLYNLSKLSVWWLRLGVAIERIKPGHPQQNGRHERMHLTLKKEATRPPGMNSLQQQARFDDFRKEFNTERPHEALAMKVPANLYLPASRPYLGLPELSYPFHDRDILVTACGRLCMHRKKINISTVMAGQRLGIKEVDDAIWLVSFMHYDLEYIDLEQRILQTIDNPFGTRLSPMS